MSDGNQTITTGTSSTTSTSLVQGQAARPPPPHTMVVSAPPPSSHLPLLRHSQQEQFPIQYRATQPHDLQYTASPSGYFYSLPYGPVAAYPPPSETQIGYSPSSSGMQRAGPYAHPSGPSPISGSSLMLRGEQLQLMPSSYPYASHHPAAFSPPSSPPPVLTSFPTDVQYPRPLIEPAGVLEHRLPADPSHHAQHLHRHGYRERHLGEEEPHSQKEAVYQYVAVTSKVQPHSQEQHVVHYTVLPPDPQQQRAQDMTRLEEELQGLLHTQKQLEGRIQQIHREKKQLTREHLLEQELYQNQQQLFLTQQSLWIQQHRMREVSSFFAPLPPYGSPPTLPLPSSQPPQQTFFYPSSLPPTPPRPRLSQGMAAQAMPMFFGPQTSSGKGQAHPHQSPEATGYSERILEVPTIFSVPGFGDGRYSHFTEATGAPEPREDEPESGTVIHESISAEGPPFSLLKPDVAEFRSRRLPRPPFLKHRSPKYRLHPHRSDPSPQADTAGLSSDLDRLQDIYRRLRNYALQSLVPLTDTDEQGKLEAVERTVVRVPAVCFNEQKFLDKADYQVLVQPQSPAVRGQEALARVCFALEQALRLKGMGAAIISDYKFRENYLRRAPPDVLESLTRPEEEGSHNILMIGPAIGIVCIQVTCVEDSTNSGTVKKQVRETLRQLQKEERVLHHVLQDLDLDDDAVHQVMALPNVTTDQLKQKLETKTLQILSSALNTTEDLEELLTLDRLPSVGHRHWLSRQSRASLWEWLDRLAAGSHSRLSVDNYLQIFARYTCGWSLPEVWTVSKPRALVRSRGHAVAETYRRYHRPVLTPQQDSLLQSAHRHVLMETSAGTGHTCLLKVKALTELRRGRLVLVLLPHHFTSLKQDYEQLASYNERYAENVYFWSNECRRAASSDQRFKTVSGTSKILKELTGSGQETFALFDFANRDDDLFRLVAEVTDKVTSAWVMVDTAASTSGEMLPNEDTYFPVQFVTVTRLPSIIQILINHADLDGTAARNGTSRSSAQDQPSLSVPAAVRVSEVSSYHGLPTDGPFPLFIWHPRTKTPTKTDIFHCHHCVNRLRSALQSLVPELFPRADADGTKDETPPARSRGVTHKARDFQATGHHSDSTDVTSGTSTDVSVEEVEVETEETSIDINSGNVPKPLTTNDVVIFVDSREHVDALKDMLDLVTVENVIHSLEYLPRLTGAEKAVVVYVGHVHVSATDTELQAVVRRLRDVMTLCQGQLILAVELEHDRRTPGSAMPRGQVEPFELDIEDMVQESWKEHGL